MRPVKNTAAAVELPAALHSDGAQSRRPWRTAYVRRTAAIDAMCALAATLAVLAASGLATPAGAPPGAPFVAPLLWVAALFLAGAYEHRFLPDAGEECRRVLGATGALVATVGAASWWFQVELARGFVVVALLLACGLTLAERFGHRAWLHRRQAKGRSMQTMLLVGHPHEVLALHNLLRRETHHGYSVIGCCLPARGPRAIAGPPVLGDLDDVVEVVGSFGVDTVAVVSAPELDAGALRRLGWDLEATRAEVLLAPALAQVAGPRMRFRPSSRLPLLHAERPQLWGPRRLIKGAFDRGLTLVVLTVLLPVLLTIAVAIKATSSGPVLDSQDRVGRGGRPFRLLRFRCALVDAERSRTRPEGGDGNGVLFQLRQEACLTPVGRMLRRHGFDELPQLLNVLRGDMSLVGPRPRLPRETGVHGGTARHLLLKPGLTGSLQWGDRSHLTWDESACMDAGYLENWSLSLDLLILGRTIAAARRGTTSC